MTLLIFRRAGLRDVQVRAALHTLQDRHPYMLMPIIGASGFRRVIIARG